MWIAFEKAQQYAAKGGLSYGQQDKENHDLDVHLDLSIVNGELIWKEKGRPNKGSTVRDGKREIVGVIDTADKRSKKVKNSAKN